MTRAGVVLLALVVVSGAAPAGEKTHTIRPGDSASAIAQRYYGNHELAELLLLYNSRRDPVIRPGETLRVPFSEIHRVRPGDTGSTLADRYLGRASAWRAVATLNGIDPGAPLRVGQKLVMPVVLPYSLVRRETLALVAKKFYGNPRRGEMLQSFNGIEDPRTLSVGQGIEVPLTTLRLVEQPPPRKTTAPVPVVTPASPPEPETPAWFEEGLGVAQRAFDRGDYDRAAKALGSLTARVSEIPRNGDRARMWRLQAFVEVAFDRKHEACDAVRAMRQAGGEPSFDPQHVSPKIRETIAGCPATS